MSEAYKVFLAADAAAYLFGLKRSEREPIRRFIDLLSQYPFLEGEATERDSSGRTVQVKLLPKIRVVYWPDHPDKSVKILIIERLKP